MKRYFYTDPLAAGWMEKHFGMRFCAHDDEHIEIRPEGFRGTCEGEDWERWLRSERHSPYEYKKRAYIHPDSLHLLEPQVGDLVKCWIDQGHGHGHWAFCDGGNSELQHMPHHIIQRDGKPFFWPEQDS